MRTPAPQRAAGRKKLAAKGQALADGTAPVPDVAYLRKAIRAKGRTDPAKWPALKRLIVKRARQLKATSAPGVKGTWAFQAAGEPGSVIGLAGPKGYVHGWIYEGGAGLPSVADHNAALRRKGVTPPSRAHLALTREPPGAGKSPALAPKGILAGPHPADKLTVASSPAATAKAMPDGDLKSADRELSRRAALLGKPGQQSRAHKAVRAELAARTGAGAQAARGAPKGRPPAGSALRGDAAYDHVPEPAGKKERDAAGYYSVASKRLNTPLRSGGKVTGKEDAAQLRALESAFARSPPTTRHIIAWRGTAGSLFGEGDATGTHFTDKGFTSLSTDQGQAAMFGPEAGSALMEIHVPAGSKVVKPGSTGQYSSGADAEKELVLGHGGRYEITGDQMVSDPKLGRVRKLTATYRGSA